MTLGQKIRESRKEKGLNLDDLAESCGRGKSWLSAVENDAFKGGPDPDMIIKIADALGDKSILTYALMHNPICQRIIPRAFRPLNNTKTDPSAILAKLIEELEEAIEAAKILSRPFSHADPESTPKFKAVLFANLEQILDVSRNIEEMFEKLKASGALSEEEHLEIYIHQQAKCEANGHHRAEVA
jgi:transcriptional regulator with XRE-family HTH domain